MICQENLIKNVKSFDFGGNFKILERRYYAF